MSDLLNIYQKLQKARADLAAMNLKKTGKNSYSNFTYYEMSDFLPSVNKLNAQYGMTPVFYIHKNDSGVEVAYLDIVDSDNPEKMITFESETAQVEIGKKANGTGGAEPIQNIGGKQSYLRRYLYLMAYEISEPDLVDARSHKDPEAEIDEESAAKLKAAVTLEQLAEVSKALQSKLGGKYRASLVSHYHARKAEIEADLAAKAEIVAQEAAQ